MQHIENLDRYIPYIVVEFQDKKDMNFEQAFRAGVEFAIGYMVEKYKIEIK